MHPNEQTLTRFYTAFATLDADTMGSCYAEDATFSDPAFTLHNRREVLKTVRDKSVVHTLFTDLPPDPAFEHLMRDLDVRCVVAQSG